VSATLEFIEQNVEVIRAGLRRRQGVLRDYVRGVARHYYPGFYLGGSPGTAKTHTVRAVLDDEIKEIYTYHRGHLTPMGLFELLKEHPDEVIVLDDLAAIFSNPLAIQILLAALERPTSRDFSRRIEYRRQGSSDSFGFRGGVICISNLELHGSELLDAFKSRVQVQNYAPSNEELAVLMLDVASRGWPVGATVPSITPAEAREVVRYVIAEMVRLSCRFDLRLLVVKGFPIFEQWKDRETESDWRELVSASIEEHVLATTAAGSAPVSRDARKGEERAVLQGILQTYANREDRLRVWREQTGKSERAYYRRLAELDVR
jgi:hypothetical protein